MPRIAFRNFARRSFFMMLPLFLLVLMGMNQGDQVRSKSIAPNRPPLRLPDVIPRRSVLTIQIGGPAGSAQYLGPGTCIDILAPVIWGKRLDAFPLVLNVPVLELHRDGKVSISVDQTQALVIELALLRGCDLSIYPRGEEEGEFDKSYDSEEVIRYLANKGRWPSPEGAGQEMPVPRSNHR